MIFDPVLPTFIVESRELLDDMEAQLLAVDPTAADPEMVNAIFRAAHTLKGSAGMMRLDHIVAFTHVLESVLDAVRDGRVSLGEELVALLLSCGDHIGVMIESVASGQLTLDEATERAGTPLLDQLRDYLRAVQLLSEPPAISEDATGGVVIWDDEDTSSGAAGASDDSAGAAVDGDNGVDTDQWHISLRFGHAVLKKGMDPIAFIRYLAKLGSIVGIVTLPDAIPTADEMDPETCYLGFEIALDSDADKTAIERVFELVRDDCALRILPPNSRISEYIRLIEDLPEETARLGDILVRCGTLTAHELQLALTSQQASPEPVPMLGTILVEQGAVQPAVLEAALAKQQHIKDAKVQENRSIRVDADKLDHLINLVGELIIAAASTNMLARRARISDLQEHTATLSGLVEEVRDSALQLRMVKIGATFNRFARLVHDVSRSIGKDIGLVVDGEDTELDKTVVERIADPLTHLVRNAIDHGIESSAERLACGKPAKGTVSLNAYHESGSVVIEVSDDGGGLKRDKILAKAIERGLVEEGRVLSDSDIFALIFEPGFSTAEQVTNMSGRGVGMDVVKRNIVALRGSVRVDSEPGVGTTVTVRLPLTLAIINGFLVGVGKSVFVVPLDMIEECVEFSATPNHDFTNLRGQVLPFIRLRQLFNIQGPSQSRQNIVVVRYAGHKAGLVVDTLLGEFQTVIKPLNRLFKRVSCVGGSTILGTGEVALILDVPALVQHVAPVVPHTARPGEVLAAVG